MTEPPEPPTELHEPSPEADKNIRARLRNGIWGSTPRRTAAVLIAVLIAVIAVTVMTDTLTGGSKPRSALEANCTTGPVAHDMRITVYGASRAVCASLNREAAEKSGEYWQVVPTGSRVEGSQLVCAMAKGSELIEVRDTGEHLYGDSFCAALTAEGWTEKEGPGEKAEHAQEAHEVQVEKENERQHEQEAQHERAVEKSKLEKEASNLRTEAGALHQKQQHEEDLKTEDEADAKTIESEEPAEGGEGKKDIEADNRRDEGYTHGDEADSFKDEAESKEREAEGDEKKASED